MARPVGKCGTSSYNGVSFPAPFSSKIHCTPVWDSSDRTVKYYRYVLTVDMILTENDLGGGTNNRMTTSMSKLRVDLNTSGKTLIFNSQGFGNDLTINSTNDLEFGPKVAIVSWEPLGSARACRVLWECRFTLVECIPSYSAHMAPIPGNIGEFNWDQSWDIDDQGMTRRSINGTLEIAIRKTGNSVTASADSVRDKIVFPILTGYKRTQSFQLSRDRRFLNFSIVDTEIPSDDAYVPNVLQMDVDYHISGKAVSVPNPSSKVSAIGVGTWICSLSGNIVVAPGIKKTWAWNAIKQLLSAKWAFKNKGKNLTGVGTSTIINALSIELGTQLFGRSVNFRFSWSVLCSLPTIFDATGLWEPLSKSKEYEGNWKDWSISMDGISTPGLPYGVRGVDRLQFEPDKSGRGEKLVNYCMSGGTDMTPTVGTWNPKTKNDNEGLAIGKLPPEKESWMSCQIYIKRISAPDKIIHRPLGATETPVTSDWETLSPNEGGNKNYTQDNAHKPIIQKRGLRMEEYEIVWTATRCGYPISGQDLPQPTVTKGSWERVSHQPSLAIVAYDATGKIPQYKYTCFDRYVVTEDPIEYKMVAKEGGSVSCVQTNVSI